jgi:hypothetical protein
MIIQRETRIFIEFYNHNDADEEKLHLFVKTTKNHV